MKTILSLIALLAISIVTQAQNIEVKTLTAGAVSNIFTSPKIIDNITVLASTSTNTTVKFYDAATASTSVVRAAYTSYSTYATNYDVVHTNESGLLVTNTFAGVYTASTSNSAVTNERPRVYTVVVPGSAQLSKDVTLQTLLGLSALPSHDCIVTITYRNQ